MKFLHRPVHAFEDVTRNFEQLEARSILDRQETFGHVTLTWAAGTFAATVVVTHGLGAAPAEVLLTPQIAHGFGATMTLGWNTPTATTFQVDATLSAVFTGTVVVSWHALR